MVDDGTRLRKSRREGGQHRILSWREAKTLEKETEQRTKGGFVRKPDDWGGASTDKGNKSQDWNARYGRNANAPILSNIVDKVVAMPSQEAQKTQEDWWNALVREDQE